MTSVTKAYQTPDDDYYEIEYRREETRRITLWCWMHPENPFSRKEEDCHLGPTGQVCIARKHELFTVKEAVTLAFYWMIGYSAYCRTGKFPDDGGSFEIPDELFNL